MWDRDPGCIMDEGTSDSILLSNGSYIREARGKFIQYKILNRCLDVLYSFKAVMNGCW